MKSDSKHWDNIFCNAEDTDLGWYEKNASNTFELLNKIPGWEKSTIFISGAGTSVLVEELLARDVKLIINDISSEALQRVKNKLKEGSREVDWLCQDISQPLKDKIKEVDIWIDRAVLHFLNDAEDIQGYFENLKQILKIGGYALFAEFSMSGATKCAGLPVHRYSIAELQDNLGATFKLVSSFDYTFINPFGAPRPYIYALFQRGK